MNRIIGFIPHLFTLGNLLCGCLAIKFAFEWDLVMAAILVGLAAVLDFFDGFLARILKVSGDLGKQLDSLADVVSFGVVPGVVMFQYLRFTEFQTDLIEPVYPPSYPLAYFAFIIPLFSAFRLAKFNIDMRQSHGFLGLPTPANAIFICSIPLLFTFIANFNVDLKPKEFWHEKPSLDVYYDNLEKIINTNLKDTNLKAEIHGLIDHDNFLDMTAFSETHLNRIALRKYSTNSIVGELMLNTNFMVLLIIAFSLLLVSNLPLFALKFKNFGWADNKIRYIFVLISLAMLIILQVVAIPFIILLYIVLSVLNNNIFKL